MICSIEEEIIRNYVKENKQERLIWELNSPKKRKSVIWKFAGSELFKTGCLTSIGYMPTDSMERYFYQLSGKTMVYFIGEDYIGQMVLKEAVQRAHEGEICIIYCGNGIGYYQGEGVAKPPRYLLSSNQLK